MHNYELVLTSDETLAVMRALARMRDDSKEPVDKEDIRRASKLYQKVKDEVIKQGDEIIA